MDDATSTGGASVGEFLGGGESMMSWLGHGPRAGDDGDNSVAVRCRSRRGELTPRELLANKIYNLSTVYDQTARLPLEPRRMFPPGGTTAGGFPSTYDNFSEDVIA